MHSATPDLALRPASELMRLERLGSLQPTHLSFAQSFVRLANEEAWQVERVHFDLDAAGAGRAIYRITPPGEMFLSVVIYSYAPENTGRTDRIIGHAWDLTATLIENEFTPEELEQQEQELLRLYEGRATPTTLIWARAQRSSRAFDLVLDSLSRGDQPPAEVLSTTGYLMRNTGMDGNGTFGTKTFGAYEIDHPLRRPYHAQMLMAYIVREFGFDLADHIAAQRGGAQATTLSTDLRRYLGIGNSSGLGLMLYTNNHPDFLDRWLTEREVRLANAKRESAAAGTTLGNYLADRLAAAAIDRAADRTRYPGMSVPPGREVAAELTRIVDFLRQAEPATLGSDVTAWIVDQEISAETQEVVNAALIDFKAGQDPAASEILHGSYGSDWDPTLTLEEVRQLVESRYGWALDIARTTYDPYYAWYQSESAEEPRRGPASTLPSPRFDQTLDLPAALSQFLELASAQPAESPIGEFLLKYPDLRATIERIVVDRDRIYHTVIADQRNRDLHAPHAIRLVNCAFFGISKTREQGPLGTVGVILLGAPTPAELGTEHGAWNAPVELLGGTA